MVPKKSYAILRVLTWIFGFLSYIFGFLTHSYAGIFLRKCPSWDFLVNHLTWVVDKKIILTNSFMHTNFFSRAGQQGQTAVKSANNFSLQFHGVPSGPNFFEQGETHP